MSLPLEIKLSALKANSCCVDKELIETSDDFYEAGFHFPAEKYLRKREIDKDNSAASTLMRKQKVACATLVPIYSGMIDYFTGNVTQSPLTLLATGKDTDFYNSLNESIAKHSKDLLRKGMRHNVAFLALNFADSSQYDLTTMNRKDQKALGLLDISFSVLSAKDVIAYEEQDNGYLKNCKTYVIYTKKSNPDEFWGEDDIEVHQFTLFTNSYIAEYVYENKAVDGKFGPVPTEAEATLTAFKPHAYGICPIIAFKPQIQVASRILPLAIDHFNRSSSLTYHLDTGAYSILCLSTENQIDKVVASNSAALMLGLNGKAEFTKCDSSITPMLRDNAADIENEMYKSLNATALNLNSTMQNNSRLGHKARVHEASLLDVILTSFADDIEKPFKLAIDALKEIRNDDATFTLSGCDEYDTNSLSVQLEFIKKLDEIKVSKQAKNYVLQEFNNKLVASAKPDLREAVSLEVQELEEIVEPDGQSLARYIDLGVITKQEAREKLGYKTPIVDGEVDKTIEINGAVSQGLVQLIAAGLMTEGEARLKIGLPEVKPVGEVSDAIKAINNQNSSKPTV